MLHKSKEWFIKHASGPYGKFWLGFLSACEAIFLPVPTDTFMMLMLLLRDNRKRWFYYATLTMLTSVLGAIIGYMLALYLSDIFGSGFLYTIGYETQFKRVQTFLAHGTFIFTFIGAVSPIPYKFFVLTAGFVKANFIVFLLASVVGRSLRLYFSAWLVYKYGDLGLVIMRRYGVHMTIIGAILIIVYIFGYMYF